ncbi:MULTISPECIES: hypothetical protein [unclassified Streptomyces]|uniref:hypothetical protein n=1 Tax=unclassified Streptomyces TaxID=2593676 RepID=UPI000DC78D62|nr:MULTISPECIES: hypothetical protein [unclassified Streptomyces]AWZ08450.1 hypothetical protein DRB89_32030 [Streptomyces sp. ICC4]AWZ13875.1 hypothetical protein DRB96_17995 [Streptomyces sp. ICC1]
MIAFAADAQSLVILGFLLAQNATSAARYREDPTYADADAETAEGPLSGTRRGPGAYGTRAPKELLHHLPALELRRPTVSACLA